MVIPDMDWLAFLSTDLKALAWPVAAVIGLLVLKRDIASLLRALAPRLQKAKGPWGELTFGQGIDELEDKLPPFNAGAFIKLDDAKRIDDVSELARLPPPYIVSQAWLRLEQTIRNLMDEQPAISSVSSQRRTLLDLRPIKGILSENEIAALNELRQLRNRAAHSLDPDITITDALRYSDIADTLIEKINAHGLRRRPPG